MEACDKNHQRKFSLIMALSIFILRCSRRGLVTLSLMASLGLASVMLPVGAAAQSINDETLEKTVIATVNNVPITYGDIALAEDELMGLIGKLPEDKRFEILLGHMIDRILASRAAEESGLDDDPQVLERAAFMKRKAMQDVFISRQLMQRVTEKEVAAYYDKEIQNGPKDEEVRARHILLDSREAADAVVVALKDGADFVTLAKERSKGPSGPLGGDLGYFGKEAMVEPFAEAAFQMQKGDISAPVKTQFGWHVIKLEDRRSKPTPKLDDVRDQIFQILIGEARQDIYVKMRAEADVQFVKADPVSE